MHNSEILKQFNEQRDHFKPYGLTCEKWTPRLMSRPDRHNEIELNFFPIDSITYLIQERKVTIPVQKLAVFWGLVPHQIVNCDGDSHYFVCTVPLSVFLDWKLPTAFTDRILRGEVLVEPTDGPGIYDEFLFTNWIKDITRTEAEEVILLEIQARLKRMALHSFSDHAFQSYPIESSETSHVEKMAMYIAQNYKHPITASDIGKEVDLHPDYANTIFKKAFGCTLSEHIAEERIGNAQRKLITGDESISEIAMNCGFNSISWFNATFKKITGLTPRRFRNEQKGDYLY